jgi:hypothetical protein
VPICKADQDRFALPWMVFALLCHRSWNIPINSDRREAIDDLYIGSSVHRTLRLSAEVDSMGHGRTSPS